MKQFFSRFSRRTWIIIGVVVLVLVGIFLAFPRAPEVAPFQTTPVERGNLVASVGATGSVHAKQTASLNWQTGGIVESVNVEIGSRVTQDQVLASLDNNSLSQNIILAEADLVSAKKALDDLLNSDTARLQAVQAVEDAEDDYERAYNWRIKLNGKIEITDYYFEQGVLKKRQYKGYASQETIDQADRDLELAEARLDDARRALERVEGGENSADVDAAKARVAAAESTLNMAKLIAPTDGTITQASVEMGDQVSAGTPGFRIDDLSSLLVDVQVSEVDINRVFVGQAATLNFDAVLGSEYHGQVVQVGQAGDTVSGIVNFTVTIEITDADEFVKPGMTAAVNIVVEEVKNVLLIPNRAVRLVDGNRVVYKLVDGRPEQVRIKLGASSDIDSELISGEIEEGDEIILNPPSFNGGPFGGG